MLQYPISMPNLSLRSKDSQTFSSREPSDRARRHLPTNRSARATDLTLSVYPSPSVAASPKSSSIPLTPYSARIPPSTPIPRSPVLSSLDVPSANVSFQHSRPASAHSSPVQDILFPGDVIGQGIDFQGERARLLPVSASHRNGHDDLNAPSIKFEVVRALGTGSYAVVYQVRQILSGYAPPTEDLSMISAVNFDDISCPAPVRYGREYALKCLSKADLDKDALSAQMFEVRPLSFPSLHFAYLLVIQRQRFTNLCLPIRTSSHSTVPSKRLPTSFYFSNTFPARTSFTFWNSHAIIMNQNPRPLLPPQSPTLRLPRAFCPLSTRTSYSRAPDYDSSPPCSPRCVRLSPSVTQ